MRDLHLQDLQWCVRRMPGYLRTALKANPQTLFVAGGFIRACIAHEEVNDIDLFVKDKDSAWPIALAYAQRFGDDEATAAKKLYVTDNAISIRGTKPMVQIIHRRTFDTPQKCCESFDFTIACAAIWWTGEAWASCCHDDYYCDLAAKRLIYTAPVRMEDAGGSMLRVLKFYKRGYNIPINHLGRVIARLMGGVRESDPDRDWAVPTEEWNAKIITGLLHEVDPNVDVEHTSHLPSTEAEQKKEENEEPEYPF